MHRIFQTLWIDIVDRFLNYRDVRIVGHAKNGSNNKKRRSLIR